MRRGRQDICMQIDTDIWSSMRVHTHHEHTGTRTSKPAMRSWQCVFSSNQSCCHPMTQPARMTLEAGTVRGTHGCEALTEAGRVGGQPCCHSCLQKQDSHRPPTRLAGVPPSAGQGSGKVSLPRLPCPPVDFCLLAVWMVTQKHPDRVYRANHYPRRCTIDFDRFVQLDSGPAVLDLVRHTA